MATNSQHLFNVLVICSLVTCLFKPLLWIVSILFCTNLPYFLDRGYGLAPHVWFGNIFFHSLSYIFTFWSTPSEALALLFIRSVLSSVVCSLLLVQMAVADLMQVNKELDPCFHLDVHGIAPYIQMFDQFQILLTVGDMRSIRLHMST